MNTIYTIGYSAFQLPELLEALAGLQIKAVIDVRSSPYSKLRPDCNKDALQGALASHELYYVFLGSECGARLSDPAFHTQGKIDFDKAAQRELFQQGMQRILQGASRFNIVLLCAEKDPLECHRSIFVCRNIRKASSIPIQHIHHDLELEPHEALEQRLLTLYDSDQLHLFKTREEVLDEVYRKHGFKIAYSPDSEDNA